MTDREDLICAVKELAAMRGRVILVSGKEVDYYVDMRRMVLDGAASPLMRRIMSELVVDLDFDAAGGLTLGTDPVVTIMLYTKAAAGGRLDAFVTHKKTRSYGSRHRIKGTDVTGWWVLVVEDTSTTGRSALTAVEIACRASGEVVAVAVVVGRVTRTAECAVEAGLEYRYAIRLEELDL